MEVDTELKYKRESRRNSDGESILLQEVPTHHQGIELWEELDIKQEIQAVRRGSVRRRRSDTFSPPKRAPPRPPITITNTTSDPVLLLTPNVISQAQRPATVQYMPSNEQSVVLNPSPKPVPALPPKAMSQIRDSVAAQQRKIEITQSSEISTDTSTVTQKIEIGKKVETPQPKQTILKEAFMVKRGHLIKNWKVRWFVLTPDGITYYVHPGTKGILPKGSISFSNPNDIDISRMRSMENEKKSRKYCFRVSLRSLTKEYVIDAQTEAEMVGWMDAINNILQTAKNRKVGLGF